MAKSNNKTHQKRMDKNFHIPYLVQAFSNVEYGGLNLLTLMTVSSSSVIFTKMCELKRHNK